MTLDDLVESFREYADDLVEPYLWSDDLVESYADRAELEACERKPLLTSSTDTDMCQIAVTADTALYTKHVAVREVYYAKFTETDSGDEHKVRITNLDELTFTDPEWEDLESDPVYLVLDDTSVQIVPTPTVDGTLEMSISYAPKVVMSETGVDAVEYDAGPPEVIAVDEVLAVPTIHGAHHYNLVYWMLHLAFMKKDVDVQDVKKALDYEARFTNYFGDPKGVNAVNSVRTVREDRGRGGWI